MVTVSRCLEDGVGDGVDLVFVEASTGQLPGDRVDTEQGLQATMCWRTRSRASPVAAEEPNSCVSIHKGEPSARQTPLEQPSNLPLHNSLTPDATSRSEHYAEVGRAPDETIETILQATVLLPPEDLEKALPAWDGLEVVDE